MLKTSTLSFLLAAFATLLAGGTGLAAGAHDHAGHRTSLSFGEPGDPKNVTRSVTIESTEIAFDAQEFNFKKGETVRFIFINKGEQPHEFMIGDMAAQAEHRKMMQEMAGIDMDSMGHAEHNSISAKPGEAKELIWTFTTAGTFEFACNYPGHAELGMIGSIVVK